MSRVGKRIIAIPKNVEVSADKERIVVKGPKGTLEERANPRVSVTIEDGNVSFGVENENLKSDRALWGLYASLVQNMVDGVVSGFQKQLEINGVGYKAAISGKKLTLALGYSHDINYEIPEGVECAIEKNLVTITGTSKQKVGQVAAHIRAFRKPEPYKGKGIKYIDEVIRRKAGKAAAK